MRAFLQAIENSLFEAKSVEVPVGYDNREIKLWSNPSYSDLVLLVGRLGEVRGCVSVKQDTVFVWNAHDSIHHSMKRAIWKAGLVEEMGNQFDGLNMPLWADFYVSETSITNHDWSENFGTEIAPSVVLYMNSEGAFTKTCEQPSFRRMLKQF